MTAVGSLVAFLVSLLVGWLAIFVAASVVVGTRSYSHAVFTALVGAVVRASRRRSCRASRSWGTCSR